MSTRRPPDENQNQRIFELLQQATPGRELGPRLQQVWSLALQTHSGFGAAETGRRTVQGGQELVAWFLPVVVIAHFFTHAGAA